MTVSKHDSPGIREIVLIMGMTGWGKSWWAKLYSQAHTRKLVYDPTGSFPVSEYRPVADIVEDVLDDSENHKHFNWGFLDADGIPSAAGALFVVQNNLLVVEECATVFDKGLARLPEWAKRHCFYGRHMGCSIVLIAQRPTYIPIDFRSQANRVVTFCQHEGADMDWLKDFYGSERVDALSTIPKFTCFDYHNGVVNEYSIVSRVKEEFGVSLDIGVGSELPSYV
jgi:hypothetical protein